MSKILGLVLMALLSSAATGAACTLPAPIDLNDVFGADLVVVGRVDPMGALQRPKSETGKRELPRFSLTVLQVLSGPTTQPAPGSRISVAFSEYPYGAPDALLGTDSWGVLVALDIPEQAEEMDSGAGPDLFILRQALCAEPLIFEMDSLVGIALRQVLTTDRDRESEWKILSEFLFQNGAARRDKRQWLFETRKQP